MGPMSVSVPPSPQPRHQRIAGCHLSSYEALCAADGDQVSRIEIGVPSASAFDAQYPNPSTLAVARRVLMFDLE